jgi:hypothetical protein
MRFEVEEGDGRDFAVPEDEVARSRTELMDDRRHSDVAAVDQGLGAKLDKLSAATAVLVRET